ncbi:MAG: hypothetical protein ACYCX3_04310 [Thermoleophilia bacterium]
MKLNAWKGVEPGDSHPEGAGDAGAGGWNMTERSVKRIMLAMTIASVTTLTALAVAGLVVTSRGPQAQALPLVRTSIAQTDPADVATTVTQTNQSDDHPFPAKPSEVTTTTTEAAVVALSEAAPGTRSTPSRRSSSSSRTDVDNTPDYPLLSLPPVTSPTQKINPPAATAGKTGEGAPTTKPTTSAHTTTTTHSQVTHASDDDHSREVVHPGLREDDDRESED